ncbi:Ubiquitin--protein ligase [Handroanthus impetiginosus]|uniref:RING-type E3 ubiquitin transferase n=1 Tax=Handroanthus impetiginosus TaxID=429701 RepID=A0A2G9G673_9LAMI|nr:Ubiquitin--protein ligase [Handroanthus impetiginosus]
MEEYTHCKRLLFVDPARHERLSFTARDEPASSSCSQPEFHIDFRISCRARVSNWELNQDSQSPHLLGMSRLPTVKTVIRLNFDQYSNQECARQLIDEEIKSWPLWDDGRQYLINFMLDKAEEVIKSMPPSHNAVYLNIHVVPVHVYVFDEREAIRSAIEQSMEEGDQECMVPAADSVIESLESMKITLSLDDFGTCPVCLEEFPRDCEAEWLRTSHYCPICRFEMPID